MRTYCSFRIPPVFVKAALQVGALLLWVSLCATAQQVTGSVCVAARIDDPFFKEPATLFNGDINSHGLKITVDRRPSEEWPQWKSLKIEGLDITQWHILAVLDAKGHPIQSIRSKFSGYRSTNLCMFYDGYQGIGLQEVSRHTPWCKCH